MQITKGLIESNWPLTNVEIKPIAQQGKAGTVGLVESAQGKYVYKIAGAWKDRKGTENDTAAFDLLRARGFEHIPKLLKTSAPKNFIEIENRFVYLLEYIEGEVAEPTVTTYRQLGQITAALHSIPGYPLKTHFDPKVIIATTLADNSKDLKFGAEYLKLANSLPDFSFLPQAVIHTDIAPTNAIKRPDDILILVDWDDAGVGPAVLDLGYILFQFTTEALEIKPDLAQAFFNSYLQTRPITKEEKSVMFEAGLFFALMYLVHGDIDKRWHRIQWALENREKINNLIKC